MHRVPFVLIPGENIAVLIGHQHVNAFISFNITSTVTFLDSVLDSNSAADPAAAPRQASSPT